MIREARIYVEGGGDGPRGKARFRDGLRSFLRHMLGDGRLPEVVACGGRHSAFGDFAEALKSNGGAFSILLVDSEGPVSAPSPWEHLKKSKRDRWTKPEGASDEQCQLMVQAMEAWFVADPEALEAFYGEGFDPAPLACSGNVEDLRKKKLNESLARAVAGTARGRYRKLVHASRLLRLLDPSKVRKRARHCERLFETLSSVIGEGDPQ